MMSGCGLCFCLSQRGKLFVKRALVFLYKGKCFDYTPMCVSRWMTGVLLHEQNSVTRGRYVKSDKCPLMERNVVWETIKHFV